MEARGEAARWFASFGGGLSNPFSVFYAVCPVIRAVRPHFPFGVPHLCPLLRTSYFVLRTARLPASVTLRRPPKRTAPANLPPPRAYGQTAIEPKPARALAKPVVPARVRSTKYEIRSTKYGRRVPPTRSAPAASTPHLPVGIARLCPYSVLRTVRLPASVTPRRPPKRKAPANLPPPRTYGQIAIEPQSARTLAKPVPPGHRHGSCIIVRRVVACNHAPRWGVATRFPSRRKAAANSPPPRARGQTATEPKPARALAKPVPPSRLAVAQ